MTNTTISYWHGNAAFQKEYDAFFKALVPDEGSCATVEGELIRAATRINYDHFNNGNCNNTSGACRFIKQFLTRDAIQSIGLNDVIVRDKLEDVYRESNLGRYTNADLSEPLTVVTDAIVQYVISKKGDYTPFTGDMFDYQEPDNDDDYYDEGDSDDEDEYSYFGDE